MSGYATGLEVALKERDAEIKRLRQLIIEYARHAEGCSAAHGDQYRCRCGWRAVEAEFK